MNGKDTSAERENQAAPLDRAAVLTKLTDLTNIEGVVIFSAANQILLSSLPEETFYDGAIKRILDLASIAGTAVRNAGLGDFEQFLIEGESRKALFLKRRETGLAAALVGGEGMNIALSRIKLQEILQDL